MFTLGELAKRLGTQVSGDADCEILEKRDVLFAYCKSGHVSRGMSIEIKHAGEKGIPYFMFNKLDSVVKKYILALAGGFNL